MRDIVQIIRSTLSELVDTLPWHFHPWPDDDLCYAGGSSIITAYDGVLRIGNGDEIAQFPTLLMESAEEIERLRAWFVEIKKLDSLDHDYTPTIMWMVDAALKGDPPPKA